MSDPPSGRVPPLADGDVYLYAHGNGAITVAYGDGRLQGVTLTVAEETARGAHQAGCQVWVGGDDAPVAVDSLSRLGRVGVPLDPFPATRPPMEWRDGTSPLMEAAANGNDLLVDDLIHRGADVHHRDSSGSSALHHAAAAGNEHAIGALAAVGADLELVNTKGFTPHRMALARRQPGAAARLAALGARSTEGAEGTDQVFEFRRSHFASVYAWLVPPLLVLVAYALLWPPGGVAIGLLVAFAAGYLLVVPPPAFWAGGVPRRLAGTTLTYRRTTGPPCTIDLTGVTAGAMGGATSRSSYRGARWIVLAHPEGHRATPRTLKRLLIPDDDLAALAERMPRIVVLALDGSHRADVLVPVGVVLVARGVHLTPSFQVQYLDDRTRLRRDGSEDPGGGPGGDPGLRGPGS